jgi:hypothetical protein
MSDMAFADAARPTPWNILRIPLLPYSLGHELLLIRSRNLLLLEPAEFGKLRRHEQVAAVMRAVMICARSWEENKQADKWLGLWTWRIRRENFSLAIADFRNYRREGATMPTLNRNQDPESKGRELGSPYLARLTAYAASCFGQGCYDQPLGQLQWMYFAEMERDGCVEVENASERQIREEIEQHQADYQKEQEALSQA